MEAACVETLQASLAQRDAVPFVAACRDALRQKAAFPALRQCVKGLLAEAHDDEEMGLGDFLLSTVEEALASPETAAICHLILDTCSELPGWHPHLAPHHATGVLLRCAAEQPRLAPKVAAAFHMTVDALSVPDQVALLDAISGLLDASATSAAGVALLLHFGTPVQRHFHLEAVLEDLVRASGRCFQTKTP
jgi:hypothetical protein